MKTDPNKNPMKTDPNNWHACIPPEGVNPRAKLIDGSSCALCKRSSSHPIHHRSKAYPGFPEDLNDLEAAIAGGLGVSFGRVHFDLHSGGK